MAQAARLCLRLQKELKLLLSDPPPGASFPLLSSSSAGSGDLSALSTIDAQIEGPEGTVYANGIFTLKIQIPDRYPFQPPIVTFATPIYHPNIDNGGRICLDILNLPPKGAWHPSLNISTVLTSIGLLLSEPNPDDGLMCEASREYKYNRQAFDHKARTMTEKYAKAGVAGSSISNHIRKNPNVNVVKIHGGKKASESENHDLAAGHTTAGEFSVGSSLSITHTKNCHIAAENAPDHQHDPPDSGTQMDANGKRKAAMRVYEEETLGNYRLQTNRRKLSLASSYQVQNKDEYKKEPSACDTNSSSSLCRLVASKTQTEQSCSRAADGSTSLPLCPSESHAYGDSATWVENKQPRPIVKKLSLGLKRASVKQGLDISNHENTASVVNSFTSNAQTLASNSGSNVSWRPSSRPLRLLQVNNVGNDGLLVQKASISTEETATNQKQGGRSLPEDFENSGLELEDASMPETIVVLDSDDSAEEETGSSRSRLSLTRRRIGGQKIRA